MLAFPNYAEVQEPAQGRTNGSGSRAGRQFLHRFCHEPKAVLGAPRPAKLQKGFKHVVGDGAHMDLQHGDEGNLRGIPNLCRRELPQGSQEKLVQPRSHARGLNLLLQEVELLSACEPNEWNSEDPADLAEGGGVGPASRATDDLIYRPLVQAGGGSQFLGGDPRFVESRYKLSPQITPRPLPRSAHMTTLILK